MKKLLALTLSLASIAFVAPPVEAKATESSNSSPVAVAANAGAPQTTVVVRRGRRGIRRVVTRTRNIRLGGRLYRETYQTRYLPNGRVTTRVISRVRIR